MTWQVLFPGANAPSRRSGLPQCPGLTSPLAAFVTPARDTTSHPARLPLLHLLKLRYKFLGYCCSGNVSKKVRRGVTARGRRLTLFFCALWFFYAAKRHLLHSLAFVICFLCGWRAGICCEHVAFWHCVRPCCTILLSYGRSCLTYHCGTILASTSCAHGLRSCWKSTKRSLQRFVLHIHPVSGWLSLFFAKSW